MTNILTQARRKALNFPLYFRRILSFIASAPLLLIFGGCLFSAIVIAVTLAPWLAPYDPAEQFLSARMQGPSTLHWLGTDNLGRDVLSRLLFGGQFSLLIAAIAVALCFFVGVVVGTISARSSSIVDEILMRLVDLLLSLPEIVLALCLIAIFGSGYMTVILAIVFISWAPFARLARALAIDIASKTYIQAAEVLGCSRSFIIFRHVIPNTIRPLAAMGFLRFGHTIITVGGLSFLGLGVQPPDSDWAAMVASAVPYIERAPYLVAFPGLAIFLAAVSVTLIGQALDRASGN